MDDAEMLQTQQVLSFDLLPPLEDCFPHGFLCTVFDGTIHACYRGSYLLTILCWLRR